MIKLMTMNSKIFLVLKLTSQVTRKHLSKIGVNSNGIFVGPEGNNLFEGGNGHAFLTFEDGNACTL